ncbi:MAG: PEGA domain-containing protein [Acidobacteriia bacterium]|nr:PEGA domain-containing protein [Terriglobia bacterium]
MPLRTLWLCAAASFLVLMSAAAMYGQAAAEYGAMTANSAGMAASVKPAFPNITLPGTASGAGASASPATGNAPVITPEAAAKTNRDFFQSHSGANPARISLHTAPVPAQAWVDGRFVGPTPLDLKLAPGHHRVLVRAPNMQESAQEFDLAAKQAQPIDLALKPAAQSTVVLHWPSQK